MPTMNTYVITLERTIPGFQSTITLNFFAENQIVAELEAKSNMPGWTILKVICE